MLVGRFHLRWWHWLLLIVLFLLLIFSAAVLGLRLSGERRFSEVTEALRSAGKPATIDDVLLVLPPLDEKVQEAWYRWATSAPTYPDDKFPHEIWRRFVTGHEELPAATRRRIEDLRPVMQPARDLLADEALRIGFSSTVHRFARVEKRTLEEMGAVSAPVIGDLMAARSLAQWFAHEAALAEDPRPALTDLDHLMRRFQQPLSLIDSMILIAIHDTRDQAYRTLALQGRLPDDLGKAWDAEIPMAYDSIASAFETERVVFNSLMAQSLLSMSWSSAAFSSDPAGSGHGQPWTPLQIFAGTWMWSTGPHDCATIAEVEAHASARLRRERLDPVSATAEHRMQFIIARISLPNLLTCTSSSVKSAAIHRIERLAVRLLTALPRQGLPRDEAELLAQHGSQSLAASGDLPSLRYERLGDDRFRLSIDPATPVPDFADPTMVRAWASSFGRPAVSDPLDQRNGSLEIQVPAVLRRP